MKLLVLALLSDIGLAAGACDPHFDACDDIHDITTIVCQSGTCTLEPENEALNGLIENLTTIDVDVCRKKCKEQKDGVDNGAEDPQKKCKFFRFEKGHTDILRCSLQTECGDGDQYCGKPDCVSGQLGCDDEGNEIKDCQFTKETSWDPAKFHVICTDVHYGDVNIYEADTVGNPIPGGTVCSTVRMCSAWNEIEAETDTYYRKLAVTCDEGTGQWMARDDTGSKAESGNMVADQGKINEPDCPVRCEELALTKYAEQPWADLICDFPLSDGKLVDTEEDGTNSCILLCDNHLHLSIDCGFTGQGEKHWHDSHGTVLTDDTVLCPA